VSWVIRAAYFAPFGTDPFYFALFFISYPETGKAVSHSLISVSVNNTYIADALATAPYIMGSTKGLT
jgi:hypothetical protein